MLDFLKKNPAKESTPTQTPVGAVLETGKEIQFKDPKTGEYVYQLAMSAENRKKIMDAMQKNAGLANQFMMICRQEIGVQEQKAGVLKAIIESEKEINDKITAVRDEHKLDKRWGLNMGLGVMERREPPAA